MTPHDQLTAAGVSLAFGGVQALTEVSLSVRQGQVHAVIGPNGAGKSSLLNCISGFYRPQQGSIVLQRSAGERVQLTRARPDQIARWGISRSFQNIELFRHMTVVENLLLGRHVHMRHSVMRSMAWVGPARRQEIEHRRAVEPVVELLGLTGVRDREVGSLPYGVQKRVELGRALCLEPAILVLDEPMAGMNADDKHEMAACILDVNEQAEVTVLMVEHDMGVVMDISTDVTVLDFGRVIATGTPAQVAADPEVVKAYLGEPHDVDDRLVAGGRPA